MSTAGLLRKSVIIKDTHLEDSRLTAKLDPSPSLPSANGELSCIVGGLPSNPLLSGLVDELLRGLARALPGMRSGEDGKDAAPDTFRGVVENGGGSWGEENMNVVLPSDISS